MAKLSVSLPDDLVQELRAVPPDDVNAFAAAAVRHELDRQHLHAFVEELVAELGPSEEAEVTRYSELFAASAAAGTGRKASLWARSCCACSSAAVFVPTGTGSEIQRLGVRRDGRRPSWAANETERVACRVGVDVLAVELCRAQRQHLRSRRRWVLDHDVEVDLLGHCRIWPGRSAVTGGALECQARGCGVRSDHHPVIVLVGHRQAEQRRVERRESCRVRAVEDYMVHSADHAADPATRSV
jgi:hypothetical protein